MIIFPLDPHERDPREHGYIPLAAVRYLERLGCPRRVGLTIRLEQLDAAIHYYAGHRRLIGEAIEAVRKVGAHA